MRKPSRKAVVTTASVPAPVGGLNARDAVANMPPEDAVVMDNFFPDATSVYLRNGYTLWATGFPGAVETLMTYSAGTGRKLFGISGTSVYDCTASGAIGAAVVTGLANARWQYVNVGTPGGQFLLAANGVDNVLFYDGATWEKVTGVSAHAITGIATTSLQTPNLWKNRVWFVEKNSLRMWYLPISSIAGAATMFDFSPLFKMGGYLVAMVNWTVSTVTGGMEEQAAFVTSEGEVALYKGTDPSSTATFGQSGLFRIGRPVGPRGFARVGMDMVAICADGVLSFTKTSRDDLSSEADSVSFKIDRLVTADFNAYSSSFGWELKLHSLGSKLLLNVPASLAQRQYVMNSTTNAWCRFTGWAANCFEIFGDKLMYGGSNFVAWADNGTSDGGSAINCDVLPAFGYFGSKLTKRFTMIRPVIQSDGTLRLAIGMNYDYVQSNPTSTPALSLAAGSPWNTSPWNTSPWQGNLSVKTGWIGVTGNGFAASPRIQASVIGQAVIWQSTDFAFERGGVF